MADVDAGDVDAVVVQVISRMARSLQDLQRTVERMTDQDVEVHFVRDNLSFEDGKEVPWPDSRCRCLVHSPNGKLASGR